MLPHQTTVNLGIVLYSFIIICFIFLDLMSSTSLYTGDEIDSQYQEELDEIVQLTGSPEKGFSMFYEIVKNLFEWDENGGGKYIM